MKNSTRNGCVDRLVSPTHLLTRGLSLSFFFFFILKSLQRVTSFSRTNNVLAMRNRFYPGLQIGELSTVPVRSVDRRMIQTLILKMDTGVEASDINVSEIKD